MLRNFFFLLLVSILHVLPATAVFAQKNLRNQSVEVLNGYVMYCNETIHALWLIHSGISDFNTSLSQCPNRKTCSLYFDNTDYLNKTENYELIPEEIYKNCLKNSLLLGEKNQKVLNEKLQNLHEILDEIQKRRDFLFSYSQNKNFAPNESHEQAWETLKTLEKLFEQYHQVKNSLVASVETIYEQSYLPTAQQSQIVKTSKELKKAMFLCRNILLDLDKNDTTSIRKYNSEIKDLIEIYTSNQAEWLKRVYRFGRNNGLDADWRFESIVNDLKAVLSYSEACMEAYKRQKNPKNHKNPNATYYFSDAYYRKIGLVSFYYYNERLLNKYNRYGMGLVQAYNAFLELADGKKIQQEAGIDDYYIKNKSILMNVEVNILLKWAEEPHKFKVAPPETKENPSTQDTLKIPPKEEGTNFSKIETGKKIALSNVLFKISEPELLPESFLELNNLLKAMQRNPALEILLEGHTDIYGNAEGNLKLSKQRVYTIKDYLVAKGISKKRIQVKWYGATRPLKTDGAYEDRKINRRVECTVLKK